MDLWTSRLSIAAVVGTLALAGGAGAQVREVAWNDVPEAVRTAIQQNLVQAVGSSVEAETVEGWTFYRTEAIINGVEREIEVTETGRVLVHERRTLQVQSAEPREPDAGELRETEEQGRGESHESSEESASSAP